VVGLLAGIPTASAVAFSGGFSPTIIAGGADLNGDGVVSGRDDSNAFFGDTSIIDGKLDCDAWLAVQNAGTAGSGAITVADDCTLVGYDGTADGVTITVTDGAFAWPSGTALPTVYPDPATPFNPGVAAAKFAWSTIGGLVNSNGDETIDGDHCHFGLIGETVETGFGDPTDGADVLGNPGANQCGFATAPDVADNGKVDLNSSVTITAADSCTNGCFFGHNVTNGIVQGGGAAPTITSFTPSAGPVGDHGHDHRDEPDRGDLGEVQRRERDDHVEHCDADRDEGPGGRHYGPDHRDDCERNGDQRYELHRDRPTPRSHYLPAAQGCSHRPGDGHRDRWVRRVRGHRAGEGPEEGLR